MQTLALSPEYFNNFNSYFAIDPEPKKISFLKKLSDSISTTGINKTQEMIDQLQTFQELLLEKQVSSSDLEVLDNEIMRTLGVLQGFVEFIKNYELDDPMAIKLQDNLFHILEQVETITKILKSYFDIQQAREDVATGKTVTIEQAFDV